MFWTEIAARPDQVAPEGDWSTWLILAGRGWGKTRTGAEWLALQALTRPDTRWAIVAPTGSDARDTCVEGVSGVLAVLSRVPGALKVWNRSLGELRLSNGSRIKLFSGDEPDRLRGPQHHGAWADETAAWRYPDAWDQLSFGLRLGDIPRVVVTTTPRPNALTKMLLAADKTVLTRGATFDNAANLSAAALQHLRERYEGTRLGRQELYGELLEDVEGALWTRDLIQQAQEGPPPPTNPLRTVVAVDPAVTNTAGSDMTGIVVATTDGEHAWVLEDLTCRATPRDWAHRVADAYHRWGADRVVVEKNNGGDLLPEVLRAADVTLPIREVHAAKGKHTRAEPVAALYEQGKVTHVKGLNELEDQLCEWVPGDASPDRMDAMVWALTDLMLGRPTPRPVLRVKT